MATTSDIREESVVRTDTGLSDGHAPPNAVPTESSGAGWLIALVALVLVGGGVGGAAYYASNQTGETNKNELYAVAKRDLLVSVTEDGNLESAANVDIKCRVEGGSTILKIVEDGSRVNEGDVLVELDSSQLEEQITQQRIAVNKAQASMVQAEKDLAVAVISKQEYLEGTFRQDVQNADAQITIAMENLRTAENTLEHVKRMFRKGYVSKLQRESQEFAVKTAKLELESAKIAKEVLEKYTKAKMLEDLQAKIDAARTRASSEKEAYELEKSKLKRLEEQLENCIIKAPQSGMVVYANEQRSRFSSSQGPSIEEGATVRERQTILRLPDLSRMQVKVNVHESKVDKLEVGMRAITTIQGRQFPGEVVSIASQPEATSFWQGNVKEYATIVKIEGSPKDLKPGMTASVEIQVNYLKDVIAVPVSCVVEIGGKHFAWIKEGDTAVKRRLRLGES
ncbi:MAG TPA: HlyD family efflux transporter periplasmic adaptor subunit, partial [Planctomycetaceae bacterium]|nr:HlyD family efflux transporter periplasmic adaptor subunit [Planctomycetaceae bacterium]